MSDPRCLFLKQEEAKMAADPEAIALSKTKDERSADYEKAAYTYGENAPEAKEAWHELYLAKKKLDECPSCISYEKAYARLAPIYREIDDILFSDFREKPHCGGKHD